MVEAALSHVRILEELDFTAIKISVKASQLPLMLESYRALSREVTTPCIWASLRPAPCWQEASKARWRWVSCSTKASATPSGFPHRRSPAGSDGRPSHSAEPGTAPGIEHHLLPHLRTHPNQPDAPGDEVENALAEFADRPHRCRHGLRGHGPERRGKRTSAWLAGMARVWSSPAARSSAKCRKTSWCRNC